MKKAYKLIPATKDNLWGGNRLREYGKSSDADRIAESWELSFTHSGEAMTEDMLTMSKAFPRDTWGTNAEGFDFFPTLTKFIDAREKLSVQVHPNDEYALKNEGQYGKTEMWYIVDAAPGAGIYMGLKEKYTEEQLRDAINDGYVEELIDFKEVKPGDVYFIPSGTVHAIGAGVLIYEIQQNSTLTYRLYDYMRRDKDGNLRELHIDKALAVATKDRYNPPTRDEKNTNLIGKCPYFEASKYKLEFTKTSFNVDTDSFLAITAVSGDGYIEGEKIGRGDTFFCPAGAGNIILETDGTLELITVRIP